jgi:hypothetical protein
MIVFPGVSAPWYLTLKNAVAPSRLLPIMKIWIV